jgi:hypothetical protein
MPIVIRSYPSKPPLCILDMHKNCLGCRSYQRSSDEEGWSGDDGGHDLSLSSMPEGLSPSVICVSPSFPPPSRLGLKHTASMRHHYRLLTTAGCTGTCRRRRLHRITAHSSKTCCCPCHRRMRLRAFIQWLVFWRYNKDMCRDEPSHRGFKTRSMSKKRARHGTPEVQDNRGAKHAR